MPERTLASELSGIQALVLDIDDTIVDTRAAMTQAGTHAARALWPDAAHAHADLALHYYEDPGGWFRRYASGELTVEQMRLARLRDVAEAFSLDLPSDAHDRYLAAYLPAFRTAQRLFGDVPALLAAADGSGISVVLLTNSTRADTAIKLEALELASRFDGTVVTTDTLGVGKPDRRVYLEACRLVDAEPARAACIGDNLEWDVVGAITAGLRGIWLDRAGSGSREQVAVRSLDEVTAVLVAGADPR
ncbi:HAD family hydrolase [Intrasporangium chromatireducens Q5-1]|uniref:HAD family hydrolase n=1 Tax=Intrasporangium chromatireducens Q5-1 TaxID=584657 RepID=W9GDV7_9MICO|nr:HAD family hydrolase [Intrasporangium chromatireducens]EWT04265.1 HAD family hydrolase [Intrasporangium chromatireducens Q5-1]